MLTFLTSNLILQLSTLAFTSEETVVILSSRKNVSTVLEFLNSLIVNSRAEKERGRKSLLRDINKKINDSPSMLVRKWVKKNLLYIYRGGIIVMQGKGRCCLKWEVSVPRLHFQRWVSTQIFKSDGYFTDFLLLFTSN